MDLSDNATGCCPRFDPKSWDKQTFTFNNLLLAKISTRSFLYTPLNPGKVYTKAQNLITLADAHEKERYIILSQDVSKWKAEHYFKVTKDVEGLEMTRMSGTFMTRVFDAPYKDFPKLIKALKSHIEKKDIQ